MNVSAKSLALVEQLDLSAEPAQIMSLTFTEMTIVK